jgi:hypothetical protein
LYAILRPEGAGGKVLSFEEAVVAGIGVDDAADGAMLGGNLWLDAAPRAAITRDHDSSLHRHAEAIELFVVFADTIVHVHQRSGHIAIL